MKPLKNKLLVKEQAYINGRWVSGEQRMGVYNPYDGRHLCDVPDLGEAEAQEAVEAAAAAFVGWAKRGASERATILRKWFDLLHKHADDLALLLTLEQGKPLAEAKGEVVYGASFLEWFAEEAKRAYGDVIPGHQADKRILTLRQPVGVAAAITPWNFPIAMITRKAGAALAAGCTMVIKPAEQTPLCALALAELGEQAGLPAGVLNIITTARPAEVGKVLTSHPSVRKLSFTGSTETGKLLIRQAADTVKNVSMELGGNAPFLVFDDADLDEAVSGAIISKYRNAGQTCVCANRILVQSSVYEAFVEKLTEAVSALKVGNGLDDGVQIGPLIDEQAVDFVEELVADAREKGASVVLGGQRGEQGALFYQPTVLCDIRPEMRLNHEEIFGPIAPVSRFETDEEAIRMANDTPYGLAAYFYARDYARIWRVSEGLEYGMVGINTGLISTAVAPFGGVKESGFGREGSKYGMDEYTELKYLCYGGI